MNTPAEPTDQEPQAMRGVTEFGVGDWADWSDEMEAKGTATMVRVAVRGFRRRRGLRRAHRTSFLFQKSYGVPDMAAADDVLQPQIL
jgi:hypothetical protein